jgi:hypothetical protein
MNKPIKTVVEDGIIEYMVKGIIHCTAGPAVIYSDGIVYPNGIDRWYLNGRLTRPDGPAVIYPNGGEEWWLNGKRHRPDGPAIICPSGHQEWRVNGKLHRTDGPAVIYPDGRQEWWVNGNPHRLDGPAIVYENGTEKWYLDGELHRTDGPAIIYSNGTEMWYLNGILHREDGPAAIYVDDGWKEWHRADSPYYIETNERGIRIGCQTKPTIADWDEWFAGTEVDKYDRDSEEFAALIQLWQQFKEQVND